MVLNLTVAALSALVLAGCSQEPPAAQCALVKTGRVVDGANVLQAAEEADLTRRLAALEAKTTDQVMVATTPSMGGYDINEYSINLARCWNLGSGPSQNGLLVLVAPNERKVRIEVSTGLERVVKDEEAKRIIQTAMIPNFKTGNFNKGLSLAVTGLVGELTEDASGAANRAELNRAHGQKQ